MKLTKTQKNFRKQMHNQKFEDDPYNYHINRRKNVGGYKPSSNGGMYIILIVIVLAGIGWMAKHGEESNAPATYAQPVVVQTNSVPGSIPAGEAYYVNTLNTALKNTAQAVSELNKYHSGAYSNIDKSAYRTTLLNAISICMTERSSIVKLNAPSQFKPMIDFAINYLINTELALTNWKDYMETGTRASLDKGNTYNDKAIQSHTQFFSSFEAYLQQNNYKYTKSQDAANEIKYWYQK